MSTMTKEERAKSSEIKAKLMHLIGEQIAPGWTFIGAEVVQGETSDYFNFPSLQLNLTLSHERYSGAGELDELEMIRSIMDAVMAGYPLEEARERSDEIERELAEDYASPGTVPLYNLRDLPYVINAGRYDYAA